MLVIFKALIFLAIIWIFIKYFEENIQKPNVYLVFFSPLMYLVIISSTWLIKFDPIEAIGGDYICAAIIVLAYVLFSIVNLLLFIFEKISDATIKKISALRALLNIGLAAFSGILLFSLVYLSLYQQSTNSFNGKIGVSLFSQFTSFFYFSIVSFATVGYGDITPVSNLSRILVSIEILFGFVTVIYGISSFSYIQKSFEKMSPFEGATRKNKRKNIRRTKFYIRRLTMHSRKG